MIPIQHERMAFKYAVLFIQNEINAITKSLTNDHLLNASRNLLEKRLNELKSDLVKLEQYKLHD